MNSRRSPRNTNSQSLCRSLIWIAVGILAPLQATRWKTLPSDSKHMLVSYMREKFELPEDPLIDEDILRAMGKRYCDNRSRLKKKFTCYPTFEEGVANCPVNINEEGWRYLCNLWNEPDYEKKCENYRANRLKLTVNHAAGSQTFYKEHKGMNAELPEIWKETHYNQKRKCWTDGSEGIYEQLKEVRDESIANGNPTTDEHLSRTVLGKKSGYICGLGPGPKPTTCKSGQTSRAQLIKEAELARQEAASA